MNAIIEIKNLTFAYGGVTEQLKNINLSVSEGEVVVITGPSGGGKSTLTRVINGLVPYFYEGTLTGEVYLLGRNLADIPSWERGKYVGNVFQDPRSQFFANEVAGEIAFGCENYGFSHAQIIENVEHTAQKLAISDIMNEKVRFLSYGMRQRIAIASANTINPPVYVMDEPSANLDMEATMNLAGLIRELKRQGKTIFIAEHRLYYLRDIADRIIYLQGGRIVNEFFPLEIDNLGQEKREQLGLRSMTLANLSVQCISTATSTRAMFEVNGLCKTFGTHIVAKDIAFSCKPGEIIAIVGRNAAGKSTLGKMLAGLLREDSGDIRHNGKKLKSSQRRGLVWYIMQDLDSQLFGEDLVDELITGQKRTPEREQKAKSILAELNLNSLQDHHPITLSGGQKQRLALGVALMYEAPVIILDEPTSGLDGKNMKSVSAQIKALAQQGHIILMITHDIECALSICSRALHIQGGRLVADFRIDSVKQLLAVMHERAGLKGCP
jgi:energy-coupling factor transport system ATP-binding protein